MKSVKENRINTVLENTIKSVNGIVNVNTIVGDKISVDNKSVVPIASVTYLIFNGGGEYGKVNIFNNSNDLPFSAANGAIVNIKPKCFIVFDGNSVKNVKVDSSNEEILMEKAVEIFNKIKDKK